MVELTSAPEGGVDRASCAPHVSTRSHPAVLVQGYDRGAEARSTEVPEEGVRAVAAPYREGAPGNERTLERSEPCRRIEPRVRPKARPVRTIVHVEENDIDFAGGARDDLAHVPTNQLDASVVERTVADPGKLAPYETDDRFDLLDDDDARLGPHDVEHPAQGRTEPEAAHDDAPRGARTEGRREAAERALGAERRAREKDHVARDQLHQIAGLTQEEMTGPVDRTYSHLSAVHCTLLQHSTLRCDPCMSNLAARAPDFGPGGVSSRSREKSWATHDPRMPVSSNYRPAPKITSLGDGFYDEVSPARFPRHELRFRNQRWAERVGLGGLEDEEWQSHFARFDRLTDNVPKPLALRYHGHQFDVYNPHLGDGRGFLFAQLRDGAGRLLDLGTKGSGTTPWSRGGDGRLTLKGGVREVLATEMLEALGVNTSKSLSLFETGEPLMRSDEPSPTRSSVLVRLSHSHIRFGTFQRLAYLGDGARLDRLLSHAIDEYFPELATGPDRVERFLSKVTRAAAALCASYMVAGFVHGVLNSDNMTITGESFDYGPYRFLPTYDLNFVAAYFDSQGLYAYGHQPRAVLRNLMRLAESLRPLAPDLAVARALGDFETTMEAETTRGVLRRLGLVANGDTDPALVGAVYAFLDESDVGYDRFFFDLHGGRARDLCALAGRPYAGARWDRLREILSLYEPAYDTLPAYFSGDRPCTLLIDEIESIWSAIADHDDWDPFNEKIREIRNMGVVSESVLKSHLGPDRRQ